MKLHISLIFTAFVCMAFIKPKCKKLLIERKNYIFNEKANYNLDSILAYTKPYAIEIDSFSNNRKVSTRLLGQSITKYTVYKYNGAGNLINELNYIDHKIHYADSIVYSYNKNNKLLKRLVFAEGDSDYEDNLTYSGDTLIVQTTFDGTTSKYINYKDSRDTSIRIRQGNLSEDYTVDKRDKYGNTIEWQICKNNICEVRYKYINKYDECGNWILKLSLTKDDKLYSVQTQRIIFSSN